jgi:hypothetical protein
MYQHAPDPGPSNGQVSALWNGTVPGCHPATLKTWRIRFTDYKRARRRFLPSSAGTFSKSLE